MDDDDRLRGDDAYEEEARVTGRLYGVERGYNEGGGNKRGAGGGAWPHAGGFETDEPDSPALKAVIEGLSRRDVNDSKDDECALIRREVRLFDRGIEQPFFDRMLNYVRVRKEGKKEWEEPISWRQDVSGTDVRQVLCIMRAAHRS